VTLKYIFNLSQDTARLYLLEPFLVMQKLKQIKPIFIGKKICAISQFKNMLTLWQKNIAFATG
jgi:hypothetical protein